MKADEIKDKIIEAYKEYVFTLENNMTRHDLDNPTHVRQRNNIASLKSQLSEAGGENRYLLALSDENVQKWIESEMPINNDDAMDEEVNKWCRKAVRLFAQSIIDFKPR